MIKGIKKLLRIISFILLAFILYIIISLVYSTVFDFQPEDEIVVSPSKNSLHPIIDKDSLSIITWNLGYGGIGKESYMFYDLKRTFTSGGYKVTTDEEFVNKNVSGFKRFVGENPSDFYVFQEVDTASFRSYYINEFTEIGNELPGYSQSFVTNYQVDRVPLPLLEPWNVLGKVRAGIATYGNFQPSETIRYQLPGEYSWPTRIFHLDRCILFQRYYTDNDKELIVINLHNSAYDQDGFMKKSQLAYLKRIILKEYKKGNYVLVGGDWNMNPPDADLVHLYEDGTKGIEYLKPVDDFMPEGWKWKYDSSYTTSRKAGRPYKRYESPEKLIDFFLISPNIKGLKVETLKQDFEFSDHEAVKLEFLLND